MAVSVAHNIAAQTPEGDAVDAVIAAGRNAAGRHWVPATSGNFSVRASATHIAITRSGVDKGALQNADVLLQDIDAPLLPGSSAEALLHVVHYREWPQTGAIFHAHGPYATVIGRAHAGQGSVVLRGWELQKALEGVSSHEQDIEVPVFQNDQDMERLWKRIRARLTAPPAPGLILAPGYLLAGHGLYAWGRDPKAAVRHLEALETIFQQIIILETYRHDATDRL
ncbi:methylthioribulose 1-phosphate dehydratase [Rhizobium puerariae]|uniref:Methylthioribulose-1-phosphate dehydratase n=1 Tax=Rhizobium puerariae TaxID=1585791 RepID=A0ABV6AE03_9HYPH